VNFAASNRTTLECKFFALPPTHLIGLSSNRTTLECKSGYAASTGRTYLLQIELH